MSDKRILLVVAIIVALFSLIILSWDIISYGWLRLITAVIFSGLAVKIVGLKKPWGLLIFGLLIVCDVSLLDWEALYSKHIYYVMHSLIMLSFLGLTIRELKWAKVSVIEIGAAVLFLVVNSWILLSLMDFFSFDNLVMEILFTVNGFLTVILVVFSFFNSINHQDNLSALFFYGILSLVVSDLMLFTIYILEVPTFLFLDNLFYVLGLYYLLKVSLENKLVNETIAVELHRKLQNEKASGPKSLEVYR